MSSLLSLPFWNAREGRLRAGWRIALALVVSYLVLPAGIYWALAKAHEAQESNLEATFSMASLFIAWALLVVLGIWLACRFVDRRSLDELGLRVDGRWWEEAAFGVALGGVLMSGILAAEIAFGWARYGEAGELGEVPRLAYVPVVALVFVAVAVNEELLFRGNQLKNLAEGFASRWLAPPHAAVGAALLSSLAFGLAHAGNPAASAVGTGNIVLAGLMLASGYLITGRLGIAMGLHFSWNFFQNLYGMPVSGQTHFFPGALLAREEAGPDWITGGAFGPEAGLTGLGAMLAGTLLTLGWVRMRYGPLRVDGSIAALPPLVRARLPGEREEPSGEPRAIEAEEPA